MEYALLTPAQQNDLVRERVFEIETEHYRGMLALAEAEARGKPLEPILARLDELRGRHAVHTRTVTPQRPADDETAGT